MDKNKDRNHTGETLIDLNTQKIDIYNILKKNYCRLGSKW